MQATRRVEKPWRKRSTGRENNSDGPTARADLLAASDAYAQGVGRLDAQLAASQAAVDAAMKSGKRMVAHHAIARAVVEFEHAAARLEELASRKSKTGTTRMLKFED